MKNNIIKKTGKVASFIIVPAINFKSLIKSWKSFKATFSEAKHKYDEDKKLINNIDEDSSNKLKSYSEKDLKKIEIGNRITLFFLLSLICYMLLQFNDNILVTFFKLMPVLMILSISSFSLSYLHFVFKNRKTIKIKEFIKEVKSNIFLLIP